MLAVRTILYILCAIVVLCVARAMSSRIIKIIFDFRIRDALLLSAVAPVTRPHMCLCVSVSVCLLVLDLGFGIP